MSSRFRSWFGGDLLTGCRGGFRLFNRRLRCFGFRITGYLFFTLVRFIIGGDLGLGGGLLLRWCGFGFRFSRGLTFASRSRGIDFGLVIFGFIVRFDSSDRARPFDRSGRLRYRSMKGERRW